MLEWNETMVFYFQSKVQITAALFVHFSTLELIMFLVLQLAWLGVCLVPTKKYIFNETIIYCILLNMGPATALNTSMHLNSSHNDWCYNSWDLAWSSANWVHCQLTRVYHWYWSWLELKLCKYLHGLLLIIINLVVSCISSMGSSLLLTPGQGPSYDNNFSNQLKHPTTSSEHLDNFCKPFMEKN